MKEKRNIKLGSIATILIVAVWITSCGKGTNDDSSFDPSKHSWEEIQSEAAGKTVTFMMWGGDPKINAYINGYVAPALKNEYNITLETANGQGNAIVQLLMAEKQAGQPSNIDMMWINGETFYQLRQIEALYGPFVDQLPNATYIDLENPFISMDFQENINGMEAPWGNVQMTLIYNSDKVQNVPQTRAQLLDYVKKYPGTFTIDNHFTGLTFLKALLIDIAGDEESLKGDFNAQKYEKYTAELWSYFNKLKPYLWKQGTVFPENVAQMHQLFAAGELYFTMSNNDAEVDNKINEGLFPPSARAYVPDFGTIQNSHYLGIPKNGRDKAAAMVAINFLLSPEAQLEKLDPQVWGDGTVLNLEELPVSMAARFNDLPARKYAPSRDSIQSKARMELAPEYMIRLAEDFRDQIINQ